jgi:hypothetical protein
MVGELPELNHYVVHWSYSDTISILHCQLISEVFARDLMLFLPFLGVHRPKPNKTKSMHLFGPSQSYQTNGPLLRPAVSLTSSIYCRKCRKSLSPDVASKVKNSLSRCRILQKLLRIRLNTSFFLKHCMRIMITLARLLGLRRDRNQWGSLSSSIGEPTDFVQNGKYPCWQAVGPVRETWDRLGPEIKDCVENSCTYGPPLRYGIYMIGRTKDSPTPTILICSTDAIARRDMRKAILESGMLERYPPIELDEADELPDLMAQRNIEPTFPQNSNLGEETIVLSSPLDDAFGRRLFIPRRDSNSLRPATAGPILYVNDKIYQLTVGHAFLEFGDEAPYETLSSSSGDCDFNGQSNSEDGDSYAKDKSYIISKEAISHDNCRHASNDVCTKLREDSSSSCPAPSSLGAASQPLLPSGVDLIDLSGSLVERMNECIDDCLLLSVLVRSPKGPLFTRRFRLVAATPNLV